MTRNSRFILATWLCSTLLSASFGQTEKQRIAAYVSEYKSLAVDEMLRTGVPAAVTLAQGILETGGGQSDLAFLANNHFGIKCKAEWTGETMLHNDDAKNECFRKYGSVQESYKDHSDFLKTRPCYAFLFKLDPTNFEGWANGLKKAGYATNPVYAKRLIKLIVENNLQDYTFFALEQTNKNKELFVNIEKTEKPGSETGDPVFTESEMAAFSAGVEAPKTESPNKNYPANTVFNINDLKVIYAIAGTSLFALANNHNIDFKKLLEYNELDETDILGSNQLIYLQKKSKKGTKDIHIVQHNETLRDIAQQEGIQLMTIMEYNGLQKGMEPATGEKIYLKYAAPNSPKLAVKINSHSFSGML